MGLHDQGYDLDCYNGSHLYIYGVCAHCARHAPQSPTPAVPVHDTSTFTHGLREKA